MAGLLDQPEAPVGGTVVHEEDAGLDLADRNKLCQGLFEVADVVLLVEHRHHDGEGIFRSAYERTQAEELLQCLRKIAPYIIVDCGSCIANDILSAIALMEADAVLRLVNCDLKSISYLSSQLPLLKDSQWDAEKQYKVASNVYPNEASEHIERVLGNVAFQIPHSEEVKAQVLEGNLLKELVLKDSKGFRKNMEAITKEVFGC